jgi:hypothetical protein
MPRRSCPGVRWLYPAPGPDPSDLAAPDIVMIKQARAVGEGDAACNVGARDRLNSPHGCMWLLRGWWSGRRDAQRVRTGRRARRSLVPQSDQPHTEGTYRREPLDQIEARRACATDEGRRAVRRFRCGHSDALIAHRQSGYLASIFSGDLGVPSLGAPKRGSSLPLSGRLVAAARTHAPGEAFPAYPRAFHWMERNGRG